LSDGDELSQIALRAEAACVRRLNFSHLGEAATQLIVILVINRGQTLAGKYSSILRESA
jgi:hypothetical protein